MNLELQIQSVFKLLTFQSFWTVHISGWRKSPVTWCRVSTYYFGFLCLWDINANRNGLSDTCGTDVTLTGFELVFLRSRCSYTLWEESFSSSASSLGHKLPFSSFSIPSFVSDLRSRTKIRDLSTTYTTWLWPASVWFLWMGYKDTNMWTMVHLQLDLGEEPEDRWLSKSREHPWMTAGGD